MQRPECQRGVLTGFACKARRVDSVFAHDREIVEETGRERRDDYADESDQAGYAQQGSESQARQCVGCEKAQRDCEHPEGAARRDAHHVIARRCQRICSRTDDGRDDG